MYHASCTRQNHVYLAGGYIPISSDSTNVQLSGRMYAYDAKANIWLTKTDMNHPRAEAVIEAVGENLILIGGGDYYITKEQVSSIEIYDILKNQWTIVDNSPGFPYDSAALWTEQIFSCWVVTITKRVTARKLCLCSTVKVKKLQF